MIAAGTTWDVINDPGGNARYEALLLAFDPEWVQATPGQEWFGSPQTVHQARVLASDASLLSAVERAMDNGLSTPLRRHRMQEVLLWLAYRFTVHALKVPRLELPAEASPALVGYMLHLNRIASATLEARFGR